MIVYRYLIVLVTFFLSACSPFKVSQESSSNLRFDLDLHPIEKSYLADRLKNNEMDWGLAMSGGGLRSAAFSFGVIQQLEHAKKMEDIDIISAVSGGSYAAYWYLSSARAKHTKHVELNQSGVSDEAMALINTCELMIKGNFVPYHKMLLNAGSLPRFYQCEIERTFGMYDVPERKNQSTKECVKMNSESGTMASFSKSVQQGVIPYFIFNASLDEVDFYTMDHPCIESGKNICLGMAEGHYEFTPFMSGGPLLDFKEWSDDKSQQVSISQASAISGAAIRKLLKQAVKNPHTESVADEHLFLSDGGHVENLGALALIRRGIKNIIVVDAEMDSDLNFEGYYILKDRLQAWGLNLSSPLLDRRQRVIGDKKWWLRRNTPKLDEGVF